MAKYFDALPSDQKDPIKLLNYNVVAKSSYAPKTARFLVLKSFVCCEYKRAQL